METLKIQTLKKGWHDRDEILLHAAFQTLVDFMEKEHPEKIVAWNVEEKHAQIWKEIKSLYKWWKTTRPARKNPLDDKTIKAPPLKFRKIPGTNSREQAEPDKKKYAAYYKAMSKSLKLEQKWFEEDQRNLHRLIEVRPYLWT
ncbi:MAG: hypothetical protein AB1750_15180 [Chloroflexota bacterium]